MRLYHNEEFIKKSTYRKFFKQLSGGILFCIAFARFFSGFQLRAYLHAGCWIFTMQTIDNILNSSDKDSSYICLVIYMKAFIFKSAVYLFRVRQNIQDWPQELTRTLISHPLCAPIM
jgi:hypothetical protein